MQTMICFNLMLYSINWNILSPCKLWLIISEGRILVSYREMLNTNAKFDAVVTLCNSYEHGIRNLDQTTLSGKNVLTFINVLYCIQSELYSNMLFRL